MSPASIRAEAIGCIREACAEVGVRRLGIDWEAVALRLAPYLVGTEYALTEADWEPLAKRKAEHAAWLTKQHETLVSRNTGNEAA